MVKGVNEGTEENPIVITAADPNNKPIMDGGGSGRAIEFNYDAHIVLDNLEVRNGGNFSAYGVGIYILRSRGIVV